MNILIVCGGTDLKQSVRNAFAKGRFKNDYKVVGCEDNLIDAAVVTSLEVNEDLGRYDFIVSVSRVVAGPVVSGRFTIPKTVGRYDMLVGSNEYKITDTTNDSYSISGVDDMVILSGDRGSIPSIEEAVKQYGKSICFDHIAYGVSSIATDYEMNNFAFAIPAEEEIKDFSFIPVFLESL